MQINKKFIRFENKEDFESQKENIQETSIVFIEDSNEIWTHDTSYKWIGWSVLQSK